MTAEFLPKHRVNHKLVLIFAAQTSIHRDVEMLFPEFPCLRVAINRESDRPLKVDHQSSCQFYQSSIEDSASIFHRLNPCETSNGRDIVGRRDDLSYYSRIQVAHDTLKDDVEDCRSAVTRSKH